jgi:hypothetical protein
MKQFSLAVLLGVAALFGVALESQASGFRRGGGCCESYAPCASAPCAAAPCAPAAPAPVKYETRKITVYKPVTKEKEVEVLVCKTITKPVEYKYTVCVPVTTVETRKITVCTPVSKQVEYMCTVMVPKTMEKKVMCTTYQCVTETIVEKVPVCKTVCVTCVDECGRCYTHRERVTEWVERPRCITKRIPIVTEKTVLVTVCEAVQQKAVKTVCEMIPSVKEIKVNVCTMVPETRVGTRLVCETVTEKVKRKVTFCEMVPFEETVQVPVCSPCATPCNDCGTTTSYRGGLFRRGCCH